MSEVIKEVVTTAEAIQGLDDTIHKIADAFYGRLVERDQEEGRKKIDLDAPVRFDVVAVQPGGGYKALVVKLAHGAFDISTHTIVQWVTKNTHHQSGDELHGVAVVFDEFGDKLVELDLFLDGIFEPNDYRILAPGVNELDPEELQEIKQSLARENKSRNDRIAKVNAERAKSAEKR
jgi:hypothetical protein